MRVNYASRQATPSRGGIPRLAIAQSRLIAARRRKTRRNQGGALDCRSTARRTRSPLCMAAHGAPSGNTTCGAGPPSRWAAGRSVAKSVCAAPARALLQSTKRGPSGKRQMLSLLISPWTNDAPVWFKLSSAATSSPTWFANHSGELIRSSKNELGLSAMARQCWVVGVARLSSVCGADTSASSSRVENTRSRSSARQLTPAWLAGQWPPR